jgi:hypothetical protein
MGDLMFTEILLAMALAPLGTLFFSIGRIILLYGRDTERNFWTGFAFVHLGCWAFGAVVTELTIFIIGVMP